MKKGRFLWSAHRITERQKAGKARSIKGKQLKNSRNTVFGLLVRVPTAAASLTGREEPVDNNEFLSIPVGFAGKLSADFTP